MPRSVIRAPRIIYGFLTVGVLVAGMASRRFFGDHAFINLYVGDALWASMVFFGIAFLFPRWSTLTIAVAAMGFCFGIEFSQLYHAPWIDQLRATTMGGLILGFSFVWSDLICYTAGVVVSAAIDNWFARRRSG